MRRRSRNIPRMQVVTCRFREFSPDSLPFSARSCERGLAFSTSVIFFPRRYPFNCFSRLIAITHVIVSFVVNESMHFVFLREAFNGFDFVLSNPPSQVTSYADIQRARATHDDVDHELLKTNLHAWRAMLAQAASGELPVAGSLRLAASGCFDSKPRLFARLFAQHDSAYGSRN